jgi:demethylmenaquinone methyltransferase/2-methoxy-6-polyprenyl-1,4-benzoquinol methylase
MPNRYYETGGQRAAKVGDLFATIAPRYDLINDLQSFGLHRWWKRRLVKLAAPGPGLRALDVCCGTGDVAFALAGQGAEVTGLDFSEPMLAVARRRGGKSPKSEVQSPRFLLGDAQQIPFPERSFDIVTVSYGLRNLSSWEQGLGEMWRVARPGGRLLVLDFGKPDNAAWRALYFGYLRLVVPVFGRVFCRDAQAYAYILESLKHYPAQHGVAARMVELGCRGVKIIPLLGGMMTINLGVKP